MTFERVKLTYERILLSEKRRMAIFRTYPEKYFDLMDPENKLEKQYMEMDDVERAKNTLITKSYFEMFMAQ